MPLPDGRRWCGHRGCFLPVIDGSWACHLHHRISRAEAADVLGLTDERLEELVLGTSLRVHFSRKRRSVTRHNLESWIAMNPELVADAREGRELPAPPARSSDRRPKRRVSPPLEWWQREAG